MPDSARTYSIDVVSLLAKAKAGWLIAWASGIMVCLIAYGVLQERIMSKPYRGDAWFEYSVFLVFCNRLAGVVVALVMMPFCREDLRNQAPLWTYLLIALCNTAATTCQYESLKYVSFVVTMLGKSFKMMPVMLWGIAISGHSYKFRDWAVAAIVTAGVTWFLLAGSISQGAHRGGRSSFIGLLLLLAFLAADGLQSTMQEKLFKKYETTKFNQMFYTNLCCILVTVVIQLSASNFLLSIQFFLDHPNFRRDVLELSAFASIGQIFILSMVRDFGALVFAATMNVRQVASMVISYMRFGHTICVDQVFALVLVLAPIFYRSFMGILESGGKAGKSGGGRGEAPGLAKKDVEAGVLDRAPPLKSA